MHLVHVNLGSRSYDISIESNLLNRAADWILNRRPTKHVALLIDESVRGRFAKDLESQFLVKQVRFTIHTIPSGEKSKSFAEFERLCEELNQQKTDRTSVILAVGGGVVGDLAGFVAASYARGLAFFQVPTTLLAQVDSSVGGKTGINLSAAKNLVGAFWQPTGVLIDPKSLDSLPSREFISGLAEVVKYGVIMDAPFFDFLSDNRKSILEREPATIAQVVKRCCELKASVVEQDEHELSGLRAILNYGHTFGHAIEAVQGYGEYLHGEAVAIGMTAAADLARQLGLVDTSFVRKQTELLTALELPTTMKPLEISELLQAMQKDKKVSFGKLKFILPTKMGYVQSVPDVDIELVKSAWRSVGCG